MRKTNSQPDRIKEIAKKNQRTKHMRLIDSAKEMVRQSGFIFFTIIVVAGLIVVVIDVTRILNIPYKNDTKTTTTNYKLNLPNTNIIETINQLNNYDQNSNPALRSGRINPFSE